MDVVWEWDRELVEDLALLLDFGLLRVLGVIIVPSPRLGLQGRERGHDLKCSCSSGGLQSNTDLLSFELPREIH